MAKELRIDESGFMIDTSGNRVQVEGEDVHFKESFSQEQISNATRKERKETEDKERKKSSDKILQLEDDLKNLEGETKEAVKKEIEAEYAKMDKIKIDRIDELEAQNLKLSTEAEEATTTLRDTGLTNKILALAAGVKDEKNPDNTLAAFVSPQDAVEKLMMTGKLTWGEDNTPTFMLPHKDADGKEQESTTELATAIRIVAAENPHLIAGNTKTGPAPGQPGDSGGGQEMSTREKHIARYEKRE